MYYNKFDTFEIWSRIERSGGMNYKERYKYLFDKVTHESNFAWNSGNVFLLANTILGGFIGTKFFDLLKDPQAQSAFFIVLISVFGAAFSFLWWASLHRITKYQEYWAKIIRDFEKKHKKLLEPIFSGGAYSLAKGEGVGEYDVKFFGINLRSQIALKYIIWLFLLFYLMITFYSFTLMFRSKENARQTRHNMINSQYFKNTHDYLINR